MFLNQSKCLIRGLFRTISTGALVSGHNYIEKGIYYRNERYEQVLICETCNHKSIAWSDNIAIFNSKVEIKYE